MGKQILMVTGSPRKGGNSDQMAVAFIRGAEAAGHQVDRFDAALHEISGCRACDTCWSKGIPCSICDTFSEKFAPLLERAEVLVFCMPLYFYGFPAQIKAPLDKMYAYAVPQCPHKLKISESALLICGGDEEMTSYGGALETYRQVAKYCGWNDRGAVVAGGIMEKGAITGSKYLSQAEALGKSI